MRRSTYERDDHPEVRNTANWLVVAHLVAVRAGVDGAEDDARDLCQAFGFVLEDQRRTAAQYPDATDL